MLCSGDDLIYATRKNLSQGGVCYIVIQIHCTRNRPTFDGAEEEVAHRRSLSQGRLGVRGAELPAVRFIYHLGFAPHLVNSTCKPSLGIINIHPI